MTDNQAILDLAKMDTKALIAMVLEQRKALAEAPKARALSMKVSDKGCISLFGGRLRRFGVTLYASEMECILAAKDDILAFIAANEKLIARK